MQWVGLLKICALDIKLTFLCSDPSDLTMLSTIGYFHKGYIDNSSAHSPQVTALHNHQQLPEVCSCKHCFRWKFKYDGFYRHYTGKMKDHTGYYSHWHWRIDRWSVLLSIYFTILPHRTTASSSCPQDIWGRNGSGHCSNDVSSPAQRRNPSYTRPVPPKRVWLDTTWPSPSPIEWQATLASLSVKLRNDTQNERTRWRF